VCGPTGQPEIGNGSACPPVDCESNDRFARQEGGDDVVCVLLRHALLGDRCAPDGACLGASAPQVCQVFERIVQARAEGACEVMVGCEGEQPPSTRRAEVGTRCGEGRVCDVTGRCSRSLDCAAFPGTVCNRNRPQDPPFCDLEVDPPGGGADESEEPRHSCDSVCDANGARCAGAWAAPGNCGRGDPIGCDSSDEEEIVCRCVPSTR
jgi:hypothetical protein